MPITVSAGIDVSAKKVDVVIRFDNQSSQSKAFRQTPSGHKALIKHLLNNEPECIVLEATGMYYLDLAIALAEAGLPVSVINPRSYKHFAELKLKGSKTDPLDAALLAEFGQVMEPERWEPPRAQYQQLRSIGRHINRLVGNCAKARNRLHALQSTQTSPAMLIKDEKLEISQIEKRIERLRAAATELIASEPLLQTSFQNFCSATGLGAVSSLSILAELCTLPNTLKSGQVSRHAGLDIRQHQSGTSVNKPGRISKAGNAYLRTALFYPALSAVRHDPNAKAFYEALVGRGKKKKQALVAVMRKYLTGLWACHLSGRAFDSSLLFDTKRTKTA